MQTFYCRHLRQDKDLKRGVNVRFQVACLFWADSVRCLGQTAREGRLFEACREKCKCDSVVQLTETKVTGKASQWCSAIISSEVLKSNIYMFFFFMSAIDPFEVS